MAAQSDVAYERPSSPRIEALKQFVRFSAVGVLQNALNIGTFALAVAVGVPFLLASVLAACLALATSFGLNRRWTFPGRTDQTGRRAARYVAIWVAFVLVSLPLLALLVEVAHLPKVLAQTIIVVAGAPLSYLAQRRWTFGDR